MKPVFVLVNLWCIGYGYRAVGFSRPGVDGGGGALSIGVGNCPGHDSIHAAPALGGGGRSVRRRERNKSGSMILSAVHKYGLGLWGNPNSIVNGMCVRRVFCVNPRSRIVRVTFGL